MKRASSNIAVIAVIALLGLTACGTEAAGGSGPGGSVTGDWTLVKGTVAGGSLTVPADRAITLTVDGDQATGTSACNSYFGTVEIDNASVRFTGLGGTEMGCEPDVMALEQVYLTALGKVREAARDGDQLLLSGDGVELRFDPVQPIEPAALVGTAWVLEATIGVGGPGGSASSPVGQPATLVLSPDGKITGSTGCNGFTGTYELDGAALQIADLEQTLIGCEPDVAAQEAAVVAALSGPPTVSIDGRMLTLTAPDGSGLVYRIQDDGTTQEPLPPPAHDTSATGWWLLVEGTADGEAIDVGDHRITLGLEDGWLHARAECNTYEGPVEVDQTTIAPAEPGLSSTEMFCGSLADLEHAYFTALELPVTYERSGDRLVLQSDHGELTFERLPDIAPTDIVGRTFLLTSLVDQDGSQVTAEGNGQLVFTDAGTYAGTTGTCAYTGTFVLQGDQVTLTSSTIDESACTSEVDSQGQRVFAAQGGEFVPVIDGDTMTIIGSNGAGVVYVVERPAS